MKKQNQPKQEKGGQAQPPQTTVRRTYPDCMHDLVAVLRECVPNNSKVAQGLEKTRAGIGQVGIL